MVSQNKCNTLSNVYEDGYENVLNADNVTDANDDDNDVIFETSHWQFYYYVSVKNGYSGVNKTAYAVYNENTKNFEIGNYIFSFKTSPLLI